MSKSLLDLEKTFKNLFNQGSQAVGNIGKGFQQNLQKTTQQATTFNKPIIPKQVTSYFDANSNAGNNFWSTPIAQGLGNAQRFNQSAPQVNLTQYANQIKAPIPRFGAQVGLGIGQDLVNLPQRLLQGGNRLGTELRTGGIKDPMRATGAIAGVASPLFDVATLGGGTVVKGIGKQAIKGAVKTGLKQAVVKGALEGAAFGGATGFLRGLSEGEKADALNAGRSLIEGAALGGAFGAGAGGAGSLIGKVFSAVKKTAPGISDKEASKRTAQYLRDTAGRFTGFKKNEPFQVAGGGISKTDGPVIKNWQSMIDQEVGVDPNYRISAGLAIRDLSRDPLVSAPKKVDQVFKVDKFNVGEKEVGLLNNLQQNLKLGTRNVRTFDDMKALAGELGTNPRQLLKDVQTGRITDKEVIALGDNISTSSQRIVALTNELKNNPGNPKLMSQLEAEEQLINQSIRKRIKGGTEAGRAVAAFRVIANNNLDPSYWLDKAQRQLGNKKITPEVITAVNEYIGKKDRLGLATFISKLGESSGLEKAIGVWKASLLTGLRTHEANIVGNTAMAGLETIKDIPATGFDMARSAITRTPRTKSFSLSAVPDQLQGARAGIKNGIEVLKTGTDPQDIAKAEFNRPLRFGNTPMGKAAQKLTDTVFRTLGAEDKVFYGAAYKRSMGEQLRLAKMNQKLTPEKLKELIEKPTEEMVKTATQDALYSTFTNDNALNDALKGAKRAGGQGVTTAIDFIAPFTRTPTNVAKSTFVDYTPVGIVAKTAQKIFKKGTVTDKELADAFGRSLTGTGALWLGSELAKRGLVSGASSSKETERSQAELEHRPANSVFINGAWHSVSKISPVGNLILLGAAYNDSGGDLSKTAFAGLKGFSENSFLQGASNVLKAVNEPDRFGSSVVDNTVAGYIPTLVSDVARGLDSVKRKPEGVVEKVQARIPGLREALPARLNALGDAVPEQGNFISKMANPFNSSKPSEDPVVNEMKRVGYNLNYTGDSISIDGVNTKLNRDQEREYQKIAGDYIKQYLPEFINSGGYSGLSKDDQRNVIEKIVNTAKDQAREELKTKLQSIQSDGGIKAEAAEFKENKAPGFTLSKGQTSTDKTISVPEKIIYRDGTSLKTINLTPPTKGEGIDAFGNKNWAVNKAMEVYKSSIPKEQKEAAYKKLDVKGDMEYAYKASKSVDIKTQYLLSKNLEHDELLKKIIETRKPSITGDIYSSDSVIDGLVDEGKITKEEAKQLKKIDYNKDGTIKLAATGKGKKGKKLSIAKLSPVKIASSPLKLSKAPTPKSSDNTFKMTVRKPVKMAKYKAKKVNTKFSSKPSLTS